MSSKLSFLEKFIILILDEKSGQYKYEISIYIELFVLSAYLFELALEEKLHVIKDKLLLNEDGVKKPDYLKSLNLELSREDKDYKVKDFLLEFFSNNKFDLHNQALEFLTTNNFLKKESQKFLSVFNSQKFIIKNPDLKFDVKKELRMELMHDSEISPEESCITFLLRESGLLEDNFSNYDTKNIFIKADNIENQKNLNPTIKALMEGTLLAKRSLDSLVTATEIV